MKLNFTYKLLLASTILLLTACDRSEKTIATDSNSNGVFANIVVEQPLTRVEIDGLSVNWSDGDDMIFYSSSSYAGSTSTWTTLTADVNESGAATFSGTLSSSLTASKVSGFYPVNAYLNQHASDASGALSTLRIAQPTYIPLSYTADNNIEPKSIGEYCYIHFYSDSYLTGTSATLTGSAKHLMSFIDFNLKSPKADVARMIITAEEQFEGQFMYVEPSGTTTVTNYFTYTNNANNTGTYPQQMDYIIFELRDSDGNLGVGANSDGYVPVRLPIIPQVLDNASWTITVCYVDGSEDIITKRYNSILTAGKVYNDEATIDLSGATTTQTFTPKLGDYYYADGTYSTDLLSGDTNPIGIVYELNFSGATTTISKVFFMNTIKGALLPSTYCSGGTINTDVGTIQNDSGLLDLQDFLDTLLASSNSTINSAVSSCVTFGDYFEVLSPVHSQIAYLNKATNGYVLEDKLYDVSYVADHFTGEENGIWYLPSLAELYELSYAATKLQSNGTMYMTERMLALPDSMKGDYSGSGSTASVDGSSSDANSEWADNTQFFVPIISTAVETIFVRTSSTSSGQNFYFRLRALNKSNVTSTAYSGQAKWANVTSYQLARPIMQISDVTSGQIVL
ncbi:MAG: hypothetical protein SNF68_02185 [Rikenellaceae bacterium]